MAFTFPAMVAEDPATNAVVKNVSFQVYAVTDTGFTTPLAITDTFNNPLAGGILNSGTKGVFPQFQQATNSTVVITDATHVYAWTINCVQQDSAISSFINTPGSATATALNATYASKANNLSDLASAATARTNLGLGDAATHPASDFDATGAAATAQTAAASDATSKVATHAGNASAHARVQVTDVLINRTVSGPPNDSMFSSPTDGMEVVDTANSRKWVRVGGNWVYTTLGSAGAFSPASVSGLVAWYDASQISGLSDGASVATWNDLSGNGNHLAQATGANQPVYKTAIQNGKSVVRFNGTSSVMSKALGTALTAPYTVIVVGRASQGTSSNECFFSGGNSTFLEGRTTGKYGIQSGSPAFAQISTGTKLNAFAVVAAIFSTTPAVRVNGVELDGTFASCANASTIYVGAVNGSGDWLNGDIAELMVYNRALTNAELLNIENYLS